MVLQYLEEHLEDSSSVAGLGKALCGTGPGAEQVLAHYPEGYPLLLVVFFCLFSSRQVLPQTTQKTFPPSPHFNETPLSVRASFSCA